MPLQPDTDVFNLPALAIGCMTMLACLIVQAFFIRIATGLLRPKLVAFVNARRPFAAQLLFLASAIVLLMSHLVQIYLWGKTMFVAGVAENAHRAMVFAGSTYTTVGFANDPIPQNWQLVTIIMATSGLFSFGWSTSVMFLFSQSLYPAER